MYLFYQKKGCVFKEMKNRATKKIIKRKSTNKWIIGMTVLCILITGGSVALGYTDKPTREIISPHVEKTVAQIEDISSYDKPIIVLGKEDYKNYTSKEYEMQDANYSSDNSRLVSRSVSGESNTYGTSAYNFKVKSPSNVTAYELDKFLSGTRLAGLGHAFVQAELNTGVNAMFLTSLATIESGWGNSYIARTKNNLFGFNAVDSSPTESASTFSSKEECIAKVAKFIANNYCDPHGRYYKGGTIAQVGSLYASDKSWATKIHEQMQVIDKELGKA